MYLVYLASLHSSDVTPCRLGRVGAALPQEFALVKVLEKMKPVLIENFNSTDIAACKWYGVTCDADHYVTAIKWASMGEQCGVAAKGLKGPPQWEHLPPTLTSLLMYNNCLSGELPLDLLPTELEVLRLSANNLHGTLDFTLVPRAMRKIALTHNLFRNVVGLGNLPSGLEELSLSFNMNLRGVYDPEKLPPKLVSMNMFSIRSTKIEQRRMCRVM